MSKLEQIHALGRRSMFAPKTTGELPTAAAKEAHLIARGKKPLPADCSKASAKPVIHKPPKPSPATPSKALADISGQALADKKPAKGDKSGRSANSLRVGHWREKHPDAARAIDREVKRRKRARLSAQQPVDAGPSDAGTVRQLP